MIPFFQGAAGGAPAPGTVFAATLYTGNGSARSITSGINLSTPGGLAWLRARDGGPQNHTLFDTQRGAEARLISNATNAEDIVSGTVTAFGTTGFSLGTSGNTNSNTVTYVAWSFARAARFFDVVTYTGNGTTQAISHALGQTPGLVIIKQRTAASSTDWAVWHRSATSGNYLLLNSTAAQSSTSAVNYFGNNTITVDPTSSQFTVGSNAAVNTTSGTYVAYLFAHDTASDGIVQCGSYTGNGSATGPTVTLGWQPQFVMIKNTSSVGTDWLMYDTARSASNPRDDYLRANLSDAEIVNNTANPIDFLSTGFQPVGTGTNTNANTNVYVYIAIRSA